MEYGVGCSLNIIMYLFNRLTFQSSAVTSFPGALATLILSFSSCGNTNGVISLTSSPFENGHNLTVASPALRTCQSMRS